MSAERQSKTVTAREAVEQAAGDFEVVFTARGVKREDGLTAAEVEALIAQGNDNKE